MTARLYMSDLWSISSPRHCSEVKEPTENTELVDFRSFHTIEKA